MAQKGGEWEAVGHEREHGNTRVVQRGQEKGGREGGEQKGKVGEKPEKKIIWTEGKRVKAKKKMRENIKLRNDRSADWH